MSALRMELPPLPARIARLPVHRGYPVPWFVAFIDGVPDFRVIGAGKIEAAVRERRCWVCGHHLGAFLAFTVGPMCAVNRISSEPPAHLECAEFSVKACPFLSRPHMVRREGGKPEEAIAPAGIMLSRNPGVALVWVTKSYELVREKAGVLFRMGAPRSIDCYAEGRPATAEEVRVSVETGVPHLREAAMREPENRRERALRELDRGVTEALQLLGAA